MKRAMIIGFQTEEGQIEELQMIYKSKLLTQETKTIFRISR
jgi:hypothetical protein